MYSYLTLENFASNYFSEYIRPVIYKTKKTYNILPLLYIYKTVNKFLNVNINYHDYIADTLKKFTIKDILRNIKESKILTYTDFNLRFYNAYEYNPLLKIKFINFMRNNGQILPTYYFLYRNNFNIVNELPYIFNSKNEFDPLLFVYFYNYTISKIGEYYKPDLYYQIRGEFYKLKENLKNNIYDYYHQLPIELSNIIYEKSLYIIQDLLDKIYLRLSESIVETNIRDLLIVFMMYKYTKSAKNIICTNYEKVMNIVLNIFKSFVDSRYTTIFDVYMSRVYIKDIDKQLSFVYQNIYNYVFNELTANTVYSELDIVDIDTNINKQLLQSIIDNSKDIETPSIYPHNLLIAIFNSCLMELFTDHNELSKYNSIYNIDFDGIITILLSLVVNYIKQNREQIDDNISIPDITDNLYVDVDSVTYRQLNLSLYYSIDDYIDILKNMYIHRLLFCT